MATPPTGGLQLLPPRAKWIGAGLVLASVGAFVLYDVLVVSDRERIESLVDTITDEITDAHVDEALTWIDPGTEPFEATVFGQAKLFRAEEAEELRTFVRRGISRYRGTRLRALRQAITLEGDTASVSLELMSDQGMFRLALGLRKHDDRWLISTARLP